MYSVVTTGVAMCSNEVEVEVDDLHRTSRTMHR